ncbi:hypothetical protein BOTBODRAFT_269861 [Botryobasidium botryosum FD-172 SS1]|uniref:Uncharacterized protein n=1 Tax=Botryobasidium botryosum (strain FD-172 SS1) TaxID=930990 RepID=A0A067MN67_BOTB1|nr:hypothetical protein BOTBODRAFT_269861 [Botryobasidium botryosum FD-172 SS1]
MTTRRVVVIYCENSAISRLDVSCSATIKALKGAVRVALKSVGKEWGVDGSYIHLEDDTILLSTDNKGYDAFENDTDAIVGDLVTENEVLFAIVPAPSARSGLPPKYASVFKPRYPLRDGHPATVSSPKDTVTALQNELAEIRAQLAKDRADRKKDKEERERNAQEKRRAKDQRKRDKAEEQERNIQEQKRAKDQRKRDEAAEEWVYKEKVNELSERVEKLQQTVKELENAMKTQDHKVDQLGGRLEAEKNERRREAQASFIEYTDAMDEFLTLGVRSFVLLTAHLM